MVKIANVVLNQDADERVLQTVGSALRANTSSAQQIRDFCDTIENDPPVGGIQFQPQTGHILMCHFGLGFKKPEIVKTRPVLVISPHQRVWTGLVVVLPISSKEPNPMRPYHFQLPDGTIPGNKYEHSWIKGDLIMAVGSHRLDRIKLGFRKYATISVPDNVLREARRCALHAIGTDSLTVHW